MIELGVDEKDLLARVQEKPELRRLFFRRVKGLKWFNSLNDAGYFASNKIPAPEPSTEEGLVTVPGWEILDYLIKTAPELAGEQAAEYAPLFLRIIEGSTEYAKENDFGNYQAWWRFAELLCHIPHSFVSSRTLNAIEYWLEDRFDTHLVAGVIGERWLPDLLESNDDEAKTISVALLNTIYRVNIVERKIAGRKRKEAKLKFDWYHAEKFTRQVAVLAGSRLGVAAVTVFHTSLTEILEKLDNDKWSAVWQPAIEDHDQNKYHHDAENVVVLGYRECLAGFVDARPLEAEKYILGLLNGNHETVKRIAIHCVRENQKSCRNLWDTILNETFLDTNYRHEVWHFLRDSYLEFSKEQKKTIQTLILRCVRKEEGGAVLEAASAYDRSCWFAAIKDHGQRELSLFNHEISIAKTEPEHPDFTRHMSSGFMTPKTPYSAEDLSSMSIGDLINTIETFEEGRGWDEPSLDGLSKAFRETIIGRPLFYAEHLSRFLGQDLVYLNSIIEAYNELWREKSKAPWVDIWGYLFSFISGMIQDGRFWQPVSDEQRQKFKANRHWVVSSVSRLLEAGVKTDEHSFPERYMGDAESVLKLILEKERGEEFTEDSDPVFVAINSPRGQCLGALINLALRSCRLEDKANKGEHQNAWEHFQPYFDAELVRSRNREYEFVTMVANYLPNFLYMSREWVRTNLNQIFDQSDYVKWLCAMHGYSYVGTVYGEVYGYLREHGHLIRALDDQNLRENSKENFIQNIVVAFLNGFENFDQPDSLILTLFERNDIEELSHLVWFVWTLRKDDDQRLNDKVFELWRKLQEVTDLATMDGQKLASALCQWASYVEKLDDSTMGLLLPIARYAHVSYNSYGLLESLARMSETQPVDANSIWRAMIEGAPIDYPEEAIETMLANLLSHGDLGKLEARKTVSEYLALGVERPANLLKKLDRA